MLAQLLVMAGLVPGMTVSARRPIVPETPPLNHFRFHASIGPCSRSSEAARAGGWRVTSLLAVKGEPLTPAPGISVAHSESITSPLLPSRTSWRLAGVATHLRYVERTEKAQLEKAQAPLGRPEASCAALIPIRKSQAWWEMTQNERRRIFEDKSRHI